MTPNAAIVDPLEFSLADLALRGALVDVEERLALLPRAVAEDLSVAEEVRLTPELPKDFSVPAADVRTSCALGSTLLQRQVSDALALSLITRVKPRRELVPLPRPTHARALGDRFVVRNGLCTVLQSLPGEGTYVSAHLAYSATADDRHEGLFQVVMHAPDGAEPDDEVARLLNPAHSVHRLEPLPEGVPPPEMAAAQPFIVRRAAHHLPALLRPLQESAERRYQRDHARIADYFAELVGEARSPKRRLDPAAVAAKVAHLVAERDAKLSDLPSRFALRVQFRVVALVCARLPVVRLTLQVQRRKLSRELYVQLPAGAQAFDRLVCDGCPGTTAKPALCDERLHVLCEVCVPSAQGRPRCPACLKR